MEAYQLKRKLNSVFTTKDVKQIYIELESNPLSSSYMIRSLLESGDIIKIQNGIYIKADYEVIEIKDLFKEKNPAEFIIADSDIMNRMEITNALFNKVFIFAKSNFYNKNIKLFNFIKDKKLAEIIIISSNWEKTSPTLKENFAVYISSFTNIEDDHYLENAKKILSEISFNKLKKAIKNTRMSFVEEQKVMEIYYDKK